MLMKTTSETVGATLTLILPAGRTEIWKGARGWFIVRGTPEGVNTHEGPFKNKEAAKAATGL
jgi:hypothetical protein